MISLTNHDSSEGEQWGRYNLTQDMASILQQTLCAFRFADS